MLIVVAFAGLVIDVGNVYRVQQALQASTDAAAAAGAGQLTLQYPPSTANAIAQAKNFSSANGGKNPITGVPASGVTVTVATSCVGSNSNLPCNNANTVTVDQSAAGADLLPQGARIQHHRHIGRRPRRARHATRCHSTSSSSSTAPARCRPAAARPTARTNGKTSRTAYSKGSCPGLDSGIDNVGLTTLPPDVNGTNDICQAASSNNYNSTTPTYTVVPLSNTYMDNAGNLIPASPLVSDINCMKPGGGTDYADAMAAANTELNLHGRPGVQKIIVLLSDGAANLGQNCVTKTVNGKQVKDTQPHCIQPCQSAVNDAATYKAQGVLIYTILYGDQTTGPACQDYTGANEVPFQQPWTAMQAIASPGNYYPDPNPTNLIAIFQQIASDMAAGTSRIVS